MDGLGARHAEDVHGGITLDKGREQGNDSRLFAGLAARNADHRVWESRRVAGCMSSNKGAIQPQT